MKLLIVEDDESLARLLVLGLKEEDFEIVHAMDGHSGLEIALSHPFDCILLDVMLPGLDGLAVCRALRDKGRTTPIIMLTAKSEVRDRVEGLGTGADDYVVKPFSFDELIARINAQIRRNRYGVASSYGDLVLDPLSRTAVRNDKTIELTQREFSILEYFVRHADRPIPEKELIENIWGFDFDPGTNLVGVYLYRLRQKLELLFDRPIIHTVRGKGYLLGEGK